MVDLRRVGASWAGKLSSYFRTGILAVALSFTGNSAIAQDLSKGFDAAQRGDYQAALKEFLPLATQGNVYAQNNLGLMYANGYGVLADDISAHMWWNIAGANGYEGARENRENIEKEMTPADISEAVKSARTCMSSDYQNCR